jgi:hypothetical protein
MQGASGRCGIWLRAGAEQVHRRDEAVLDAAVGLLFEDLPAIRIMDPQTVGHVEPVAKGADLRVQDLQVIGAAEPFAQVGGCSERVRSFVDSQGDQGLSRVGFSYKPH